MSLLFDESSINKMIVRLSYEIIEKNKQLQDLVLVGIRTRGVPLAHRIATQISKIENCSIPVASLEIKQYRDDIPLRERGSKDAMDPAINLNGKRVILIDDVLHKGRTVRAAMDAIVDQGRPLQIQLLVLIDRGHREFPIRPDYIGKNIPTSDNESIKVRLREMDGEDCALIIRKGEEE